MSENIKNISINSFEKAVDEHFQNTNTIEWCGLNLVVRRYIGIEEMMAFVSKVTESCFGENFTYQPEMKDPAMRLATISLYTNITLPSNIQKAYEFVYSSDIFPTVLGEIDAEQFDAMMRAVDRKITNMVNAHTSMINRQISELYSSFNELQTKLSGVFDGINKEDIKNIVKAISGGQFDEAKLMTAFLDSKKSEDGED